MPLLVVVHDANRLNPRIGEETTDKPYLVGPESSESSWGELGIGVIARSDKKLTLSPKQGLIAVFLAPLSDERFGFLHGRGDGGVAFLALPKHAADVENADQRTAEVILSQFDPAVALSPPGTMGVEVVERLTHEPSSSFCVL